ncbi:hypothetical protein EYF80_025600 [Liparis tanakae]|uniref:Uncharacterized protein n=1 Tax=Liparis tanakae TaxID=230148 RepID=A0A4Z2HGX0_9TELE|nr:hypothetical protein EYF80_025600 [Liparis tanakae]
MKCDAREEKPARGEEAAAAAAASARLSVLERFFQREYDRRSRAFYFPRLLAVGDIRVAASGDAGESSAQSVTNSCSDLTSSTCSGAVVFGAFAPHWDIFNFALKMRKAAPRDGCRIHGRMCRHAPVI